MTIKNLMEDIVNAVVEEVLAKEAKNPKNNQIYKEDIITYVLNRIPARYYTSERGILHGKLNSQFTFQQRTDILLLTHEAIKMTKNRRASELTEETGEQEQSNDIFLPHIIGEVLEETTFSIIPDIEVYLLFKNKPVKMIDNSWKNPYVTNLATEGFFHFWPRHEKDLMPKEGNASFNITFKRPKFKEKNVELKLNISKNCNTYKSHVIPMVLLKSIEGADLSFLKE